MPLPFLWLTWRTPFADTGSSVSSVFNHFNPPHGEKSSVNSCLRPINLVGQVLECEGSFSAGHLKRRSMICKKHRHKLAKDLSDGEGDVSLPRCGLPHTHIEMLEVQVQCGQCQANKSSLPETYHQCNRQDHLIQCRCWPCNTVQMRKWYRGTVATQVDPERTEQL